jgi:hypothetical protein
LRTPCTTVTGTVAAGQTFHGGQCGSTWCTCSASKCLIPTGLHSVRTTYLSPACQPAPSLLTANAASNQTGYDLTYTGAYFASGARTQVFLSGVAGWTTARSLGYVTANSKGGFGGYSSLTCAPGGGNSPQTATLTAGSNPALAFVGVAFSCVIQR